MTEKFKVIPGFSGYEVSNLGKLRKISNEKIMKGTVTPTGQLNVFLTGDDGQSKLVGIHRMVSKTFNLFPETERIYHRDGNKNNNSVDNLMRKEKVVKVKKSPTIFYPDNNIDKQRFECLSYTPQSGEKFLPIPCYPTFQASNLGHVINQDGALLKPLKNGKWHMIYLRDQSGALSERGVHQLVGVTFGLIDYREMVMHIDGDTANNSITNLKRKSSVEKDWRPDEKMLLRKIKQHGNSYKYLFDVGQDQADDFKSWYTLGLLQGKMSKAGAFHLGLVFQKDAAAGPLKSVNLEMRDGVEDQATPENKFHRFMIESSAYSGDNILNEDDDMKKDLVDFAIKSTKTRLDRTMVSLHYKYGFEPEEIADILGSTYERVKSFFKEFDIYIKRKHEQMELSCKSGL